MPFSEANLEPPKKTEQPLPIEIIEEFVHTDKVLGGADKYRLITTKKGKIVVECDDEEECLGERQQGAIFMLEEAINLLPPEVKGQTISFHDHRRQQIMH